jgi:glycosyltransferase involved in cell wall biosynthesis
MAVIRPIRVLELRSVRGTGGGPEKTILLGAARTDPRHVAVTVCYMRDERDRIFGIDVRAAKLGVDYVEVRERHSFDRDILPQLREIIRSRGIDIVHAHDYKTNVIALWLARSTGIVPLSTVHGWTGHTWKERLLYYPADKRVLARFPHVLAVSGQIRGELIKAGAHPDRVTTLLNGIDHRLFRHEPVRIPAARASFGLTRDDIVIGSVGRLEPQKRFDLLIQAFVRLQATRPQLRLVIAGDGSLREQLQQQVDAITFPGTCPLPGHQGDVTTVFHAMDIFVQSSDYEGTPNAVLEAMAFETPVVATDVGGTAELVTHGVHGLIVPAGDASLLADAIGKVLDDPPAAMQRALAARMRVERELSFDARVAALNGVYDRLMSSRRGFAASSARSA